MTEQQTPDREKKIAEVLDLSKPVSDCPECGGLGEIRSLGSRRKCECLYIRLKTLKRELDRKDEENQKLRCELESAKNYGESVSYWRQIASKINQEAQQEIERLKQERNKLIERFEEAFSERAAEECLRIETKMRR